MVYKTKIGAKKEYSKIKTLARGLKILSKCKKAEEKNGMLRKNYMKWRNLKSFKKWKYKKIL